MQNTHPGFTEDTEGVLDAGFFIFRRQKIVAGNSAELEGEIAQRDRISPARQAPATGAFRWNRNQSSLTTE